MRIFALPSLPLSLVSLASFASLVAGSGCIVEAPVPDPIGNVAFDWSFAGETDCGQANVAFVTVLLAQGGEVVFEQDNEACFGGGLTITDIDTGTYDAVIQAFDDAGNELFEGGFTADVPDDHRTFNAGLVTLDPTGDIGPPAPEQGTLSFFWAFHYPTDAQTVEDCALAGVEAVDVIVTPSTGEAATFTTTSTCDEEHQGLTIDNLDAGDYTLELVGHGSYDGDDVVLYDSGAVPATVDGSTTTDLGNVVLARNGTSFSDFNISWFFDDSSVCPDNGASTIALAFQRDGEATSEDTFVTDCSAAAVVRRTFVPGHYTVTGSADTSSGTYAASVGVDLPPNSVGDVQLSLSPQ